MHCTNVKPKPTNNRNNNNNEQRSIQDPNLRQILSNILSLLIHVKDFCKHGVTLYFLIDKDRKPVHDVPAVYFVLAVIVSKD
ncbi:putative sec1-like protein [Medicago truncatula]|uniref:Putative sec1-like protein n=1 Tax=Medicago truncatula TaxID=3880 RepID=G7L9C6_MEDTR|nr:Sec1-family transporter [Medicago truncatula]RHN40736.1 putative sec1-like protein [Medicago truncatula]